MILLLLVQDNIAIIGQSERGTVNAIRPDVITAGLILHQKNVYLGADLPRGRPEMTSSNRWGQIFKDVEA